MTAPYGPPAPPTRPMPSSPPAPRVDRPAVVAAAASYGIGLALLDLVLSRGLQGPLVDVLTSAGAWAVAASLLARHQRLAPAEGALAGAALLVAGVLTATALGVVEAVARLDASVALGPGLSACVLAGLAGAALGAAGSASRDADPWRAAAAVALPSAVLLAQAWLLHDIGSGVGAVTVLTLLATAGLLRWLTRDRREVAGRAAALVLPVTVVVLAVRPLLGI